MDRLLIREILVAAFRSFVIVKTFQSIEQMRLSKNCVQLSATTGNDYLFSDHLSMVK